MAEKLEPQPPPGCVFMRITVPLGYRRLIESYATIRRKTLDQIIIDALDNYHAIHQELDNGKVWVAEHERKNTRTTWTFS